PKVVQEIWGDPRRPDKAAKLSVLTKGDQAFKEVLRDDVYPSVAVDAHFEGAVVEVGRKDAGDIGVGRPDHPHKAAFGVELHDAGIARIGDVERFVLRHVKAPGRAETVFAAI